jgi:hypothetical protein
MTELERGTGLRQSAGMSDPRACDAKQRQDPGGVAGVAGAVARRMPMARLRRLALPGVVLTAT